MSDFRGIVEFAGVMIMVWLLANRPETGGFVEAARLLGDLGRDGPGLVAVKEVGAGTALGVAVPGWLTLAALVLITSLAGRYRRWSRSSTRSGRAPT